MNGQGYHYHPIDCKKYVYCNVGHITELSCPGDLVYDLSSGTGQCTFKDNVPCAREMVESTSTVYITQITISQSEIDSSISLSRLHTTSQNILSTTMEITGTQIVPMSSQSTSTDFSIQPTGTTSIVTSSTVQG